MLGVTMFFRSRLKTFFLEEVTTYICTSHVTICLMFPKLSRKVTTYICTSHVTMFFRSRLKTFFFGRGHNIYVPPMSLCFFVHGWKLFFFQRRSQHIYTSHVTMFFRSRLKTFFFGEGHNIYMYLPCHYVFSFTVENFFFRRRSQHIYTPPMSLYVGCFQNFFKLLKFFNMFTRGSLCMLGMSLYKNFFGRGSQHIYVPPMSLCFFIHGWKLFFFS